MERELPVPPSGFKPILRTLGPGVIMASLAIGSGEWILFPAVVAAFGPKLLWMAALSCILQAVLAIESMKFPIYNGQPVHKAIQKMFPGPLGWAWAWALMLFIPVMWPAWATASATAITALQLGRLPGPQDTWLLLTWTIVALLVGLLVLHVGNKVQRTLEMISWPLVIAMFVTVLIGVVVAARPSDWTDVLSGLGGFLSARGGLPPQKGINWMSIAAAIAYIPAGFGFNLMLSSYARDKGWGMANNTGFIAGVVGGKTVELSTEETPFNPSEENLKRWRGWLKVARIDSWVIFSLLTFITVLITSVMVYSLLTPEQAKQLRGFAIAAAQAEALTKALGGAAWIIVLLGGFWILFDTQWGLMDATSRVIADNFWFASERVRRWCKGDIRRIYYAIVYLIFVVSVVIAIGSFMFEWTQPFLLVVTGAFLGLFALTVAYPLQIIVNYKFLPKPLRPSALTTFLLAVGAVFYGLFLVAGILQALFGVTL